MHYIAQDVTKHDVTKHDVSAPFILVAAQTLMQAITPTEIQGRVFASRSGLPGTALIIAVVASPLLSQHVFEPLMRDGQILSSIAGLLDAGKRGDAGGVRAGGMGHVAVADVGMSIEHPGQHRAVLRPGMERPETMDHQQIPTVTGPAPAVLLFGRPMAAYGLPLLAMTAALVVDGSDSHQSRPDRLPVAVADVPTWPAAVHEVDGAREVSRPIRTPGQAR